MDSHAANLLFIAVMAAAIVVWLWSLTMALRLGRAPRQPDHLAIGEAPEFDTVTGELTIRGDPAGLSKGLARSLRQQKVYICGMLVRLFRVTERSSERLAVEKTGPLLCNQPPGLYFSEAEFRFVPEGGDKVRVSYRLGYARLVRLLRKIALCIIVGVGLPTLLIVGSLIWLFVVRSADPTIRWQVFETFQIVHALWPPFLFMGFYALGRRQSRIFVENLVASAEELD